MARAMEFKPLLKVLPGVLAILLDHKGFQYFQVRCLAFLLFRRSKRWSLAIEGLPAKNCTSCMQLQVALYV